MCSLLSGVVPADGCFATVDQITRTVQDALRQCDLFMTDYSPTAFDVAYLGTPLIYAQFDAEEFFTTGGYRKGCFDARGTGSARSPGRRRRPSTRSSATWRTGAYAKSNTRAVPLPSSPCRTGTTASGRPPR